MKQAVLILNPLNTNLSEEVFNFSLGLSSLGIDVIVLKNEMPDFDKTNFDYIFVDQLAFNCCGLDRSILISNSSEARKSIVFLVVSKPLTRSERNIVTQHRIKTMSKPILPISLLRKFRGLERQ